MRTLRLALLGCVVLAAAAVSCVSGAEHRVVNVNFAGLFSSAASAERAPPVQVSTVAESCGADSSDVAVNFDGMLAGMGAACETSALQMTAHCAMHQFNAEVRVTPFLLTMPGLCRNFGEIKSPTACVQPGGVVQFEIQLLNTGTGSWPRSNFKLELQADPTVFPHWQRQTLQLERDTQAGQNGTFIGLVRAPAFPGYFELQWQLTGACGAIGKKFTTKVEVTCSNGIFCDGMERYVNNKCVKALRGQCDDSNPCTVDTCDEKQQLCQRLVDRKLKDPTGVFNCSKVASCTPNDGGGAECIPNCNGKVCGGDGCGHVCGPLAGACPNRQSCTAAGQCILNRVNGTCADPYRLIGDGKPMLGRHLFNLDTSKGLFAAVATCNNLATAGQIMVSFKTEVLPPGKFWAIDARLSDGIGVTSVLDTVLEMREGQCYDPTETETQWSLTGKDQNVWCSDDAAPPGGVGSRVSAKLKSNTTYYLVAGGYNSDTVGPATLDVTFVQDYVPSCLSRYCGPDGGGGQCGVCPVNTACDEVLRCSPTKSSEACTVDRCINPVVTDENGVIISNRTVRTCGADGCGGFCGPTELKGLCPGHAAGELCVLADGTCAKFEKCDHYRPVCHQCTESQYCGNDCACHSLSEDLPDLIIDAQRVKDSVLVEQTTFDNLTCAYAEQCITGLGARTLLRFDTTSLNQGFVDLILADPTRRPDEFSFSKCHNHYHYDGYAEYRLMSLTDPTLVVARGHKQGYCMQDSTRVDILEGPSSPCNPKTTCTSPGISAGWSDVYGNDIDCQWIDVTGVTPGRYMLHLELNVHRRFLEGTLENNAVDIEVEIPAMEAAA